MEDKINPSYYRAGNIEVIDIIEQFGLGFSEANILKYLLRAGKKTPDKITDLKKCRWYLDRLLKQLEKEDTTVDYRPKPKSDIPFTSPEDHKAHSVNPLVYKEPLDHPLDGYKVHMENRMRTVKSVEQMENDAFWKAVTSTPPTKFKTDWSNDSHEVNPSNATD